MPIFEYEVADRSGALSRGRVEAASQGDLITRFREQGRLVLAVRPAREDFLLARAPGLAPLREAVERSVRRAASGVGLATLVLFTGQLAAMLSGGLHLIRILGSLAAESTSANFRRVLEDVRGAITAGSSFAEALDRHPHIFDRLYVAVVRAGELSGSLPVVLDTLGVHLEKVAQLRRKVRGAIAYPSVILGVSILIVFVMVVKIVPVFENVYARANAVLPGPTVLLIRVSGLVREYTVPVALLAVLAVVALYLAVQTGRGRWAWDTVKLRVPLFGPLVRMAVLARTCRTLSVLLNSGIPLMEAMETVSRVAGNALIERALAVATRRLRDGGTVADALRQTGQFPAMVVQLAATGEESGTLPAMLARAAGYYEQQVDSAVATLSTLLEPVMIVLMGAIAGSIIFALYLPIFTLGQVMRGGLR